MADEGVRDHLQKLLTSLDLKVRLQADRLVHAAGRLAAVFITAEAWSCRSMRRRMVMLGVLCTQRVPEQVLPRVRRMSLLRKYSHFQGRRGGRVPVITESNTMAKHTTPQPLDTEFQPILRPCAHCCLLVAATMHRPRIHASGKRTAQATPRALTASALCASSSGLRRSPRRTAPSARLWPPSSRRTRQTLPSCSAA